MVIMWGVGGLLIGLGVVLVVASLLGRGGAAENQRLWVVSGLVMTGLGVVAISAAALAGDDDDGGDPVAATGQETSTTSSDGKGDDSGDEGSSGDDDPASDDEGFDGGGVALPDCFDEYLSAEPVVAEANHLRLDEGVNRQLIPNMHQADAIALELVDGDELLGVMRVGDQAMPVSDTLHVFDAVDPSCQAVPFTPQDTDDQVADTHQTVIPLELGGRQYEVTFVQHGIQPELDVVLRLAG
jgi:hypothetical protein